MMPPPNPPREGSGIVPATGSRVKGFSPVRHARSDISLRTPATGLDRWCTLLAARLRGTSLSPSRLGGGSVW